MNATLYIPNIAARSLTTEQVHGLRMGDLMHHRVAGRQIYHLCAGNARRIDRYLGLVLSPKPKVARCETLASGPRYVAYAWPNAADDASCQPNPAATAHLNRVAGNVFQEMLVGPILIITA